MQSSLARKIFTIFCIQLQRSTRISITLPFRIINSDINSPKPFTQIVNYFVPRTHKCTVRIHNPREPVSFVYIQLYSNLTHISRISCFKRIFIWHSAIIINNKHFSCHTLTQNEYSFLRILNFPHICVQNSAPAKYYTDTHPLNSFSLTLIWTFHIRLVNINFGASILLYKTYTTHYNIHLWTHFITKSMTYKTT